MSQYYYSTMLLVGQILGHAQTSGLDPRELAADYLRQPSRNVTEVAMMVGFTTTAAFPKAFRRRYGTSPSEFRRQSP